MSHADLTVYSGSTHQADRRCIRGVRFTVGNICDEIASGSKLKIMSHADLTVYSGSTHQADRRLIKRRI